MTAPTGPSASGGSAVSSARNSSSALPTANCQASQATMNATTEPITISMSRLLPAQATPEKIATK